MKRGEGGAVWMHIVPFDVVSSQQRSISEMLLAVLISKPRSPPHTCDIL